MCCGKTMIQTCIDAKHILDVKVDLLKIAQLSRTKQLNKQRAVRLILNCNTLELIHLHLVAKCDLCVCKLLKWTGNRRSLVRRSIYLLQSLYFKEYNFMQPISFFILAYIHSFTCLMLGKRYLRGERFHKSLKYLIPLINAYLMSIGVHYFYTHPILVYTSFSFIFLLEVLILFKDRFMGVLGVTLGAMLHFFVIRAATSGLYALYSKTPVYEIYSNTELVAIDAQLSFVAHIVVLILFLAFFPANATKKIIKNNFLIRALNALMFLLFIYMIYNSYILCLPVDNIPSIVNAVTIGLYLLIIFYVAALFLVFLVSNETYDALILELEKKVDTDTLTGLHNKLGFVKRVSQHLETHQSGAMIVIDLDNFKLINDNFGHLKGDELLHTFAKLLEEQLRPLDILGRFGGDEFVIFLRQGCTKNRIADIFQRLKNNLQDTYITDSGEEIKVSISLGVASYTDEINTYEKLFNAADEALYAAKRKGKDTFEIHNN